MDALKKEEPLNTIDDIYLLPNGTRAELIDGQIYYMSPPGTKHQKLLGSLFNIISNYIQSNDGKCEAFVAPFAVFLNADNKNYVESDISVICNTGKLDDKGCHGAPDWIIEIVSPESRKMDYLKKLIKYRQSGVKEYWIADIEKNRIIVYLFDNENDEKEAFEEYTFSDSVKVNIYEDFEIDFSCIKL